MVDKETGFFRRQWNYFKRGKSELNFLLNIYQTLVLLWGVGFIAGGWGNLITFTMIFGIVLFALSLGIGKYSLEKLDPTLPFINPFTQDIVLYKKLMAEGLQALADDNKLFAMNCFRKADKILERWIKDDS